MMHVVAYDIEDNRVRSKLARFLEKKGIRLQKSVFTVKLKRYEFKRFLSDIGKIINDGDEVAVFRLCKGCEKNALQQTAARKEFAYVF